MVESSDGSPWSHPATTKIVFNKLFSPLDHAGAKSNNSSEHQMATAEAHCCYLAMLFFHGLSNKSHRKLKKNFTTMPSRALIWSSEHTTKCYSWRTNTSHPTSRTPPGAEGAGPPLLKKVRLAQPPLTHPPHQRPRLQLRRNGSLI
jgi:hypothetical protein